MLSLLLIVFCFLCFVRIWFRNDKSSIIEPPQISGRWPIVGHAYLVLGDRRHMYNCIHRISKECIEKGGIATVYAGPRKIYASIRYNDFWPDSAVKAETIVEPVQLLMYAKLIVVLNFQGVVDPEDSITIVNSSLQKHYFYNFAKPLLGNGLLTADVLTWKRNRKLLNPAFNQQVLDGFIDVFNNQAENLVKSFGKNIGIPFDHEILLRKNNLETICLTALGVDASEYNELYKLYLPRLMKQIQHINDRMQKFWLHNDIFYSFTKEKRSQKEELQYLTALSKTIIEKKKLERNKIHIRDLNYNYTGKSKKAFMDHILDLADETIGFTDNQVREETDTIIAGGHETIAGVMTLVLTVLGSHRNVQDKAYDEILEVLGRSETNVDRNSLSKLVYIEAILNEIMRLYPILPIMPRVIEKDIKLKNYTIKAKSDCFISIYGLHRHSMWGPDADQFRPERWLEKETLPDPKYYGAFGLGRRSCIGKHYAIMSMKIILFHILRKFIISSDISKMVLKLNVMPRPESGHYIKLTKRLDIDA